MAGDECVGRVQAEETVGLKGPVSTIVFCMAGAQEWVGFLASLFIVIVVQAGCDFQYSNLVPYFDAVWHVFAAVICITYVN